MLTNNFASYMNRLCTSSNNMLNDSITTVKGNKRPASYSYTRQALSQVLSYKYLPNENEAPTGCWLVLGNGTTPPQSTDVTVESLVEDYTIITQSRDTPNIYTNTAFIATKTIQNTSVSEPLTISEVCLFTAYGSSSGNGDAVMLAREVIEPVTLQPGEKHEFSLAICVQ